MRTLVIVLAFIACVLAAGCNTVQGIGEDIQWIGQELQEAAD